MPEWFWIGSSWSTEERVALDRSFAEGLPAIALALFIVWIAVSVGHVLVLHGTMLAVMLPIALVTCASFAALWLGMRRFGTPVARWAHPIGAAMMLLIMVNCITHLALSADARQSTNITLLLVATGCVFTSLRWLMLVNGIALLAWSWVFARYLNEPDWVHWSYMNFMALALGITALRIHASLLVRLHRAARAQTEQAELLRQLSLTDPLTGLANRRAFDATLRIEWERAARSARVLSALVVDVDHFKRYNDSFGHLAGDECLKRVAMMLRGAIRTIDSLGRFGGEEFVVLLPETGIEQACEVAERARGAIEAAAMPHAQDGARIVTVSIGIACAEPAAGQEAELLLEAADAALYRAKAEGRNRCVRAERSVRPQPRVS